MKRSFVLGINKYFKSETILALLCMLALFLFCSILQGCSDSGSASAANPIPDQQRIMAATLTAENNAACTVIRPFYWEIGNSSAKMAGSTIGGTSPGIDNIMMLASASKLMYSAYVVQKRNGTLTPEDIQFLTFRSGYTSFSTCLPTQTVGQCAAYQANGTLTPANVGKFYYGGGHMEKHDADVMGLANDNNYTLAAEILGQIKVGNAAFTTLIYHIPQLAGGAVSTPGIYAAFLRNILSGKLLIRDFLGSNAVCTNPLTCKEAIYAPAPSDESMQYSLGHWVEEDGTFSSPGAFGFYPWIDSSKTYYGMVAREAHDGILSPDPKVQPFTQSMYCGRIIKKAWMTGVVQQ